jgi:hypothetical protein
MEAKLERKRNYKELPKVPAQILVWTMVNVDDVTSLSDEDIVSLAEMQKNWKVARP